MSNITRSTTWFNNGLNCTGDELCLTSCLSSIPTTPLNQCSNEVGVRCSKCTISIMCSLEITVKQQTFSDHFYSLFMKFL